ncbi:hypothetical protein O0L34_g8036 [Tuta absoluta]|nr:hypothetical protein O0L34_g8036 [Tuta absoluta]
MQWCILMLFFGKCFGGYIYHLNTSEYARMPPLFHLDPYDTCLHENDSGVYCSVKFHLVSNKPIDLYTMIVKYSEKTEIHFNHTKLQYGICLTKSCRHFYKQNITTDLAWILEACLNEKIWEIYKLKTHVDKNIHCGISDKMMDFKTCDISVAVLLAFILVLNIVGSLKEATFTKSKNIQKRSTFLSCFSIARNWRNLLKPAGEGADPRLKRLKLFHGIKSISVMLVIMFHSIIPYVVNLGNPRDLEEGYKELLYQIIANGTFVVQSFFVMSGFLISYNIQGRTKATWISIPQAILHRWMRLTPPYLVVLAITATWLKYFGSGPLWQSVVISEVEDCHRAWWHHLLYINNYFDYNQCMLQTWYVAADFQLFCVGVLVFVLTSGWKRKFILALLFVFGLFAPAVHTYIQDLHGVLLVTPEASRDLFVHDPTFNSSYKRGHTNVASFVIGLSLGVLVYHWQRTRCKIHWVLRHRFVFWWAPLLPLGIILLSSIFYRDAPRDHVYIRMFFAAFAKPMWAMYVSYFIIGIVFQFEDTVRGMIEWDGWIVPSRVSYCAYLLHMMLIKVSTGTKRTVMYWSLLNLLETIASTITLSFLAAILFYLLVEAPFQLLIKLVTSEPKRDVSSQMVAEAIKINKMAGGDNDKKVQDKDDKQLEKRQIAEEGDKD